ncbi:MAG: DNA mismatch repair protein MutS [Planctomyces sp.]|nr:DNA mismatch repair protein MutS [Planctomyces sp.]
MATVAPAQFEQTISARSAARGVYEERREHYRSELKTLNGYEEKISLGRGVIFILALLFLYVASGENSWSAFWLLLPGLLFLILVVVHGRILRKMRLAQAAVTHYENGLRRINDTWYGIGPDGKRFADDDHPYANDLDLFGDGSLFQLISQCRTRLGETMLSDWLKSSAPVAEIRQRQTAVKELADKLELREELALLHAQSIANLEEEDQTRLLTWFRLPPRPIAVWVRVLAGLLALSSSIALVGYLAQAWGANPLFVVLLVQTPFLFLFRKHIYDLTIQADEAASGLRILSRVLSLIERQSFESPLLQQLQEKLKTEGHPPSYEVRHFDRLVQRLQNCVRNQFFAPLAFLFCLPVHVVDAIERWKATVAKHVPDWLDTVGQFEALSSLATFHFEHADFAFPELSEEGPLFDATHMGHPLLPYQKRVHNDLNFGQDPAFLMVSGSNMSGKSTLLRTVGLNAALAGAGAPVCATALTISRFQIGTTMRVSDSLQQGFSHFFAVISRLKLVVELTRKPNGLPVLFLLDEILQGTNSHDRREGAEAVIRNLLERGAVGLVTTHDLSLTRIVPNLPVPARNIHFEDRLEEGELKFDYHIQDGVVQHSNALELMRIIGLTEPADEQSSSMCDLKSPTENE